MKVLYSSSGEVWKVSVRLKVQVEIGTPGKEGAGPEKHLAVGLFYGIIQRGQRSPLHLYQPSVWMLIRIPELYRSGSGSSVSEVQGAAAGRPP